MEYLVFSKLLSNLPHSWSIPGVVVVVVVVVVVIVVVMVVDHC